MNEDTVLFVILSPVISKVSNKAFAKREMNGTETGKLLKLLCMEGRHKEKADFSKI